MKIIKLKQIKSFSMAEMLMVMVIVMVLLVAAFPLISQRNKLKSIDTSSANCIRNILASNPNFDISESNCLSNPDNACCVAAKSCYYNQNNTCLTIQFYADQGKSNADIYGARKLFREVCDRGGKEGCKYFLNICDQDSANCNITNAALGVDFDLNYYLSLNTGDTNSGMGEIEQIVEQYYNSGFANITSMVDTIGTPCTCPTVNLACIIKGNGCGSDPTTPTAPTTPTIPTTPPWSNKYGGTNIDTGNELTLDTSGNIYVTGDEYSDTAGSDDAYVMKLDIYGNIIWMKRYGGSGADQGCSIRVDSNGYLYLAGQEYTDTTKASTHEMFAMKMDNDGNAIWKKRFGGTLGDMGRVIVVDNTGNIYLSGQEQSDATGGTAYDAPIIKLDNNGNVIWKKKYGGTGNDMGKEIYVQPSQNLIFLSEESSATYTNSNVLVMKLDPNGNTIWKKKFSTTGEDYGYGLAEDQTGNIYMSGFTSYGGNFGGAFDYGDISVVKLDSSGNIIWKKRYGSTSSGEFGYDLKLDSSGNIFIAGCLGSYTIATMKLDTNGNIIWQRAITGTISNNEGQGISVDSAGKIYLSGRQFSDSFGNSDIYIIKMEPNPASNVALSVADWTTGFTAADLVGFDPVNLNTNFDPVNLSTSFSGTLMNATKFKGGIINTSKLTGIP